jgi:hypothetical protein
MGAFNRKEFNGLSLFGVGSGTTIDYVEFFHGADDGVEFFGGTVNTSNLISIGRRPLTGLKDGLELTQTGRKIRFRKRNRGIGKTELGYLNTPSYSINSCGTR